MHRESGAGSYRRFPKTAVETDGGVVRTGFDEIRARLAGACRGRAKMVLTVECYPGVDQRELLQGLQPLQPALVVHSDDLAFEPEKIDALLAQDMTDDPVFGILTVRRLEDYFYPEKIDAARRQIAEAAGLVLVFGVGASLVHPGDVQVLADITRWEIQLRYRRGMPNWRTAQTDLPRLKKYKRGYFAEWRWCDKVKETLLGTIDFYLDMATAGRPAMAEGGAYRRAMEKLSGQPFRMVPYFDPGVWGATG